MTARSALAGVWHRIGAGLSRRADPAPEPSPLQPPLAAAAVAALEAGRAALARGDREAARAAFRQAVALDGRALCRRWGLIPLLEAEGRGSVRRRMQDRLQHWYRSDAPPPVARLAHKLRMRDWAAEQGIEVPRLLVSAPNLDAVDWAALPADDLVIKPSNATHLKGVVVMAGGVDSIARRPVAPDLQGHVRDRWQEQGILASPVLIEERVIDAERPDLPIPRDFKAFAVAGRVAYVVVLDRNVESGRGARQSYDRLGFHVPPTHRSWPESAPCRPPPGYADLIAQAERLSAMLPWALRFDLYLSPRGPLLGEITTYPSAGLDHTPFSRRVMLQMLEIHPD